MAHCSVRSTASIVRVTTTAAPGRARAAESVRSRSRSLFDRRRSACFFLGASLVPSTSIDSARVVYDQSTKQWATTVHFKNDDFLKHVATPLAGKQIAIVLAGFVQAAPMIKPALLSTA